SYQQNLAPKEEYIIEKWIITQDKCGFPPKVSMVVYMAQKLLKAKGEDPTLGGHWINRFLDRHPILTTKFSMQVIKQRVFVCTPEVIKDTILKLAKVILEKNITPNRLFNMDEK